MNAAPDGLAPLLLALGLAGIELAPHPTDLSARLRSHRGAILGMLVGGYAPDAHRGDAEYIFGERLGVAEGLSMATHPGSPGWLVAVGESMASGCHSATHGVCSENGTTDEGDSGCGEGERSNALRDREGFGRGP